MAAGCGRLPMTAPAQASTSLFRETTMETGEKTKMRESRQSNAVIAIVNDEPWLSVRLLSASFAHRIAAHLDPVGIVDQPVEDAIGRGRIADLFVPAGHRQLGRENHRTNLIAVLANLPE